MAEKKFLDSLRDGATQAEGDPDRYRMEEAILATLAKGGPDDPFQEVFFSAYNNKTLTFKRSDLDEIAQVLGAFICVEGRMADEVLIKGKLRSIPAMEALPRILGASKAVDTDTARAYVDKIHTLDKARGAERLRDILGKVVDGVRNKGGDIKETVTDLAQHLYDLAAKKLTTKAMVEAEAAKSLLEILDARRADGRDYLGLDSGFKHLNDILNGLTEGLFILGGMPSCGKTTLAKQIADHVAEKEKIPVLFYSFEHSAEELQIKSLARLSQVDSRVIWKGHAGSGSWAKIEQAAEEYLRGPGPYLTIVEAGGKTTVEAIRAAALMTKHKAGEKPILLILDYLQVIPVRKGAPDNIDERIDGNLSELRRLSRDLRSPVLVVSTLNRAAYGDPTKPSTLTIMKEGRGIECSADVVIRLWRDTEETGNLTGRYGRPTIRVEARVLKNRYGELAKVNLNFTPSLALFTEGDKEDPDCDAVDFPSTRPP